MSKRRSDPDYANLMGSWEVRRYFNISRQRVDQLANSPAFPEPVVVLGQGRKFSIRIWKKDDIEAYARKYRPWMFLETEEEEF